ncbi:DUF7854 family protein [Haladaptatus sp. CMSO5]|uniref:DUF7854 family protein n=1 Tax=Haladaptatus sp. CMSO5 TaxID=3120514 RepID=UPI002FCE2CAF
MDRISALRNIEDALAAFEHGEMDLATMEQRVRGVLRTYATEFADNALAAYRASGDASVDGLVVVAASRAQARERILELSEQPCTFTVERVDSS